MNRVKKLLYGFCMAYLLAVLFFPVSAFAEQSTTLTATVPSSHSVRLVIGEHGSVEINGETYSGTRTVRVERLEEQSYLIRAEEGWRIKSVTYGQEGQAEEVSLEDSVFTAPALNQDGNVLAVTIEEDPDWTGTETESEQAGPKPSQSKGNTGKQTNNTASQTQGTVTQSVQTGDDTHLVWWVTVFLLSLAGILIIAKRVIC